MEELAGLDEGGVDAFAGWQDEDERVLRQLLRIQQPEPNTLIKTL